MAYTIRRGGSDWAEIYVKEADTAKDLENDHLMWAKFTDISWTHDNQGFFYERYESPESLKNKAVDNPAAAGTETDRDSAHMVYYHRLGTKQEQDVLIFTNPKEVDNVYFSVVTNDGKYLLVDKRGDCDFEEGVMGFADISQDGPNSKLDKPIEFTRFHDTVELAYLHNIGCKFYFRTKYKAPN